MIKILAVLLIGSWYTHRGNAQQFDQLTRPVAILSDSSYIHAMLKALLIPAIGDIHQANVVDVTANGFGPNDLIILYPSMETYEIGDDVPQILQESMKTWEIEADYRLDATRQEGQRIASSAYLSEDARVALTADVLGIVSNYYKGDDMDLRMSQDSEGVRLEIWNYDPDALQYQSPVQATLRDTLWQTFRFASPAILMSFKDVSDCIETYAHHGQIFTRPCP